MSCSTSSPVISASPPLLALGLQAVDQLGAQDVDLAVQQPAPVGDLALLLGQLSIRSLSSWSLIEPMSGKVSSMLLLTSLVASGTRPSGRRLADYRSDSETSS